MKLIQPSLFDEPDPPRVSEAEVVQETGVAKGLSQTYTPQVYDGVKYIVEDGVVWFWLRSVCSRLGIENPAMMAPRIKPEWKRKANFDTGSGIQLGWMVTWDGFCLAVQRSNKPEAIPLQEKMAELLANWIRNRIGQTPQAIIPSSDRVIVKRDDPEVIASILRPMFGEFASQIVNGVVSGMTAILRPDLIHDTNDRVQRIESTADHTLAAIRYVSLRLPIQRKDPDSDVIEKHRLCLRQFTNGRCPRCHSIRIVGEDGRWIKGTYEVDHWYRRDRAKVTETWAICKQCHAAVSADTSLRDEWSHCWWQYLDFIAIIEQPLLRGTTG